MFKDIDFGNVFRNFLLEKKEVTNFFFYIIFYIFHKKFIIFLYNDLLMNALRKPFNQVFKNQFSFSFFFGSGPTIW